MDTVTIGRLAELAGVHIETIRYYERRGLLTSPPRADGGGYRRYDDRHLWRLEFIRRAKALGFTLAEITDLLGPDERTADDVGAAARSKLAEIEETMRALAGQRCQLRRLMDVCAHGDGQACQALQIETEQIETERIETEQIGALA